MNLLLGARFSAVYDELKIIQIAKLTSVCDGWRGYIL